MRRSRWNHRFGILLQGSKIRISELSSIIIIGAISLLFISFSWHILRNEFTIYRLTGMIKETKSDKIILAHFLEELQERVSITELLCSIAGEKLTPELLLELSDIVFHNSTQFGYDPLLLLAVIEVESVFRTNAKGRYRSGTESGALGLMQIKPATAREIAARLHMDSISENDLFKPEINVILGVSYLTSMISRFKSFKLGLLAYNQGPGIIQRKLSDKSPLSVAYYQKVLRSYYALKTKSLFLADAHEPRAICR